MGQNQPGGFSGSNETGAAARQIVRLQKIS